MEAGQAIRIALGGGEPSVETGLPVLDHLVGLLARAGGFELALELAPDEPEAEVDEAGRRALDDAPPGVAERRERGS